MNEDDRSLLTRLDIKLDYVKLKVDSLDSRVAIQNGRVTEVEKMIQHSKDTVNNKTIHAQISDAIEANEKEKFTKNMLVMGGIVALVTLIINIAFHFIK